MSYPKVIQEVIEQARVVSKEELLKIFEENIERIRKDEYGNYGNHKFYFLEREKEEQETLLKRFDKGEKVPFLVSYDHFGYGTWGEDTITRLYTDGTYDVETHLAD